MNSVTNTMEVKQESDDMVALFSGRFGVDDYYVCQVHVPGSNKMEEEEAGIRAFEKLQKLINFESHKIRYKPPTS